jgi:hypothetical protein
MITWQLTIANKPTSNPGAPTLARTLPWGIAAVLAWWLLRDLLHPALIALALGVISAECDLWRKRAEKAETELDEIYDKADGDGSSEIS